MLASKAYWHFIMINQFGLAFQLNWFLPYISLILFLDVTLSASYFASYLRKIPRIFQIFRFLENTRYVFQLSKFCHFYRLIWALFEIMISPDHIWSHQIIFSTKMLITSNKRNYSCGEDVFPTVYYSALDVRTSFSSISFDRKKEHTEI